jgi:hypothetical protein
MSTSLRRCRLAGAVCRTRAPNPDRAFQRVGGQPQDQREVAGASTAHNTLSLTAKLHGPGVACPLPSLPRLAVPIANSSRIGTVKITKAWKKTPSGYELGQPKTCRSVRTINVPASVLYSLDFSHDWLFTNSEGRPIRLYSWRTNVWVPSLTKARTKDSKTLDKVLLEKQPRIHDLRHTCASWLLGAGVPLITVSAHLGHEDAATTARIYGHLDGTAGQAAAAAMANLLD